ncbi:MAG: hypothetical protein KME27_23810 [Lyngbya sp. HA4199-MV5]|nr:hypothetical protein [Lyngbya sp. HA4199-MV5]
MPNVCPCLPRDLQLRPGAVLRLPATWDEYESLNHQRGEGSLPRLKYRCLRSQHQRRYLGLKATAQ